MTGSTPARPRDHRGAAHVAWQGALVIGDCWATWVGRSGENRMHRHFAAQAARAPGGVRLTDRDGRLIEGGIVLVDPLVLHRLEPVDDATLVYIEPGARATAGLKAALLPIAGDHPILRGPGIGFWAAGPRASAPSVLVDAARALIDAGLDGGRIPLTLLADAAGLSPERFRHRFAAEAGVPLKRYVLWRRLRRAALEIGAGEDATRAAHAAGFADSSHFARTLALMFGVTASTALLGRNGSISCAT